MLSLQEQDVETCTRTGAETQRPVVVRRYADLDTAVNNAVRSVGASAGRESLVAGWHGNGRITAIAVSQPEVRNGVNY